MVIEWATPAPSRPGIYAKETKPTRKHTKNEKERAQNENKQQKEQRGIDMRTKAKKKKKLKERKKGPSRIVHLVSSLFSLDIYF